MCCARPSRSFRKRTRQRADRQRGRLTIEHLNGEDGLGAIFPAMANTRDDVRGARLCRKIIRTRAIARKSVDKLLVVHEHEAYCQPCVSPVWDTGLTCHALLEAGGERMAGAGKRGLDWLVPKQVLDVSGDWSRGGPTCVRAAGRSSTPMPHYPDLDDTAVVVMAMDRAQNLPAARDYDPGIARAREWIVGMQSANGGWGAFDADNEYHYLNNIPFADHGALLDPPTEDVTARCVSMLAQLGETPASSTAVARGVDYLRRTQLAEGSWYGRWGMNYIYGTWSVLCALNAAGVDHAAPEMRKAVDWLVSIQNADGGWGEDGASYKLDYQALSARPPPPRKPHGRCLG